MDVPAMHHESFYRFLQTLDCYLASDLDMQAEVGRFADNPQREIAAFVSKQAVGEIEVAASFIRLLYVLKGSVILSIDQTSQRCQAGSLIVANEATQLSYQSDAAETEVITFYFKASYFSESLLGQFFEEPTLYRFFVEALSEEFSGISRYFLYSFAADSDVHFYTLLLLKQVVKMFYFNNKVTKAAFVLLVVEISQAGTESLITKDSYVSNSQLIEEILAYIDVRLEQITLEEVAQKFHFHPNYLSAMLKEKTGHSFTELVLKKRVALCKQYLSQTDLAIQTIVERLGYKDKAFFYKRFKQLEGMTPRQYRKGREN